MAHLTPRHGNGAKSKAALPCEIGLISVVPNLAALPIGIGSGVRFAPRAALPAVAKSRRELPQVVLMHLHGWPAPLGGRQQKLALGCLCR